MTKARDSKTIYHQLPLFFIDLLPSHTYAAVQKYNRYESFLHTKCLTKCFLLLFLFLCARVFASESRSWISKMLLTQTCNFVVNIFSFFVIKYVYIKLLPSQSNFMYNIICIANVAKTVLWTSSLLFSRA